MYDFHSEHDTLKKCLKEIDKEFGKFTEQHNNYWNVHIYDTEASIVIVYPECLQSKNQNE